MRSERPKPLHRLCGRPMVLHVLHALAGVGASGVAASGAAGVRASGAVGASAGAGVERAVVVVGHGGDRVTKAVAEQPPPGLQVEFVEQRHQRGTGDAVASGVTAFDADLDEGADVLVLPGDTPLLRPSTLAALVAAHRAGSAAATVLTARFEDPTGYGRVVRDRNGKVARIVEEVDATPEERAIDEVNTGIYVFRSSVLAPALRRLTPDNAQGEYYLTDVVAVLHDAGYGVGAEAVADPVEVAGVNDRAQLAGVERELRARINREWLARGVTMIDPAATYLDVTVELATDVCIYPGTLLQGATTVAAGAELGPNTHLSDCRVGARAVVTATVGRAAEIGADAQVGPWAHLPPGAVVPAGRVTGPGFVGTVG